MTFYLKGNETLEALLELCRLHHLTTPIITLERFRDFDMWVVTIIDNDEKAEKILYCMNVNAYHDNVLKIEVNKN